MFLNQTASRFLNVNTPTRKIVCNTGSKVYKKATKTLWLFSVKLSVCCIQTGAKLSNSDNLTAIEKNGEAKDFAQNATVVFPKRNFLLEIQQKLIFNKELKVDKTHNKLVYCVQVKTTALILQGEQKLTRAYILTSQLKKKITKRRKTGKPLMLKSFILLTYLFFWCRSLFLWLMDVENQSGGGGVDDIEQEVICWYN